MATLQLENVAELAILQFPYAQLLKVFLNCRGQLGRFRVQSGEFIMNLGDGLLKIEILVHLRRGNADVAARGEDSNRLLQSL